MDADNLQIFELFKRINDSLEKNANSNLQSSDITLSQMKMLFFIRHSENSAEKGCMPLKELERRFGVAQSTAAGIILRLEKKGLVESVAAAEDRRVKILRVTDKGKFICGNAEESMEKMPRIALNGFTESEKRSFEDMLKRVLANIEQAK